MKPQICKEPKKLAELGVRNFFGDFNARNKEGMGTNIKGLQSFFPNYISAIAFLSFLMIHHNFESFIWKRLMKNFQVVKS